VTNPIYRPNPELSPRTKRQIRNIIRSVSSFSTTVTDSTSGTVTIRHTLGRIPMNFRITYANNSGTIYATGTWTKNLVYFKVPGGGTSSYWKIELY